MIGRTISHYRILEQVGSGGMGVVYKAEDTKLKRPVALKFLPAELTQDETSKKRLVHEARAVSALQHHNISTIHEIDETDDGQMFICMDYYEGETLKDRLARGPLSVDEAVDFTVQVAEGLAEAHSRGMLHRDIKPANVMVTKQGEVKILDFGLAKLTGQSRVTKTGSTVGTVAYMSPEQVRGEDLDQRSDIFSLGVMLCELLTGASPFAADYEPAIMHKILNVAPAALRTSGVKLAAQLEPVVGKMLAKEPSERYGSVREVIADLSKVRSVGAAPPTRRKTRRIVVASATLAVLLAAALGLWRMFGPESIVVQASEPRLAILYFENVAEPDDPERLGEIATNLLITDLSESKYVTVVSSQRLYDILKKLGKEGVKVIDRDTATEVAREAGASEMLVGSIMRAGDNVEIASQLVDVASGESRAAQRIRGDHGENIFTLVDRLSAEVRSDLELPIGAKLERDVAVADVTTHSSEAYRYYLEGREHWNRLQWPEARASFERAIEIDSTFAMAWIELAQPQLTNWGGLTPEEQKGALAKAVAHSGRASRKEARYISAWSNELSGDRRGAIASFEELIREFPEEKRFCYDISTLVDDVRLKILYLNQVIAIDPMDKVAYNDLAYYYQPVGDFEKSMWAINQCIHLDPGGASWYEARGHLYGTNGQIAQAFDSIRRSVELDSAFGQAWVELGQLYLVTGDEARARECWGVALKLDKTTRAWARFNIAAIPLYGGHAADAIVAIEEAIAADERDEYDGIMLRFAHLRVGTLYARRGDWQRADTAFRRMRKGSPFDGEARLLAGYIWGLSELDVSRAEGELAILRTLAGPAEYYSVARSWVEMANGRYDRAVEAIDSVYPVNYYFLTNYTKGVAYLRAGRWEESIEKLEYCRDMWNGEKASGPIAAVRVHHYLGQAYEANGETAKAIKEYETFVEIWKDADSMFIGEVNDARQRLQRLRQ